MLSPLAIFVLWHHENQEGEEYANAIFSEFRRNTNDPLSRGMNIPVFFRSHKEKLIDIPFDDYQQVALVPIVDPEFVNDNRYTSYLEDVYEKKSPGTIVLPVATHNSAFNLSLGDLNFIRLFDKDHKKDYLISFLAHDITRHLFDLTDHFGSQGDPPLKLFISHAKCDGLEIAKRIKRFVEVESELPLKTFFDSNDISIGSEFSKEIEQYIEIAVVIAIQTDKYSSREWCRKEVLLAKEHDRPIVILNCFKDGETRSFPYMANVLTVHFLPMEESAWPKLIGCVLKETLRLKYQQKWITYINSKNHISIQDTDKVSGYPPELMTLLRLKGKPVKRFIYPDPPLGKEELAILKQFEPNMTYLTPAEL